ncbi:sensor histidine kinase [Microbacterium sp. R86528]|uniref:sensor histidine kinase n=1 Tax=Microbacterium sp. R86528 TaxID=3093864 RepID=UPI0037CB3B3F
MAADTSSSMLDGAWEQIPSTREATQGIGSFTRTRVERIITFAAGLGSLVLGLQSFLFAIDSTDQLPQWHLPLMLLAFVPLAVLILTCLIGRGMRVGGALFAVAYVVLLALWPVATDGIVPPPTVQPWIWFLVNVATLAAVIAFPLPLQIVWTILVPLMFGVVRVIEGEFSRENFFATSLDVSFALILGGVLLALGWLFRSMAANVDETRARAVSSYADAAATEAVEQERAELAALMHDSVLAALIAAERAHTPREQTLSAGMARDALTRLANTEQDPREGSDAPGDAATIAHDLEAAVSDLGANVPVTLIAAENPEPVPGRICRALTLAATQGIANALQHADGVGLAVSVQDRKGEMQISVHDNGGGFDLDNVANDRLGIKASIIARVAAVGGRADIHSTEEGTSVLITWRRGVA